MENSKYLTKINNVLESLEKDLIEDIVFVDYNQDCPNLYTDDFFQYNYPGTIQGCNCDRKWNYQLKKGICCNKNKKSTSHFLNSASNYNNNECVCQGEDVLALENHDFNLWDFGNNQIKKGCILREKGYSILNKSPKIDGKNQAYCEDENDQLCSKVICYPKNKKCPINEIYFQQKSDDKLINLTNDMEIRQITDEKYIIIYRQNKDSTDLLTDFQVTSGKGVCLNKQNNFDSGRDFPYILELQQYRQCSTMDKSYKPLNISSTEYDFFNSNRLDKQHDQYLQNLYSLPEFDYDYQLEKIEYKLQVYKKNIDMKYMISDQCFHEIMPQYQQIQYKITLFKDEFYQYMSNYFWYWVVLAHIIINIVMIIFIVIYNLDQLDQDYYELNTDVSSTIKQQKIIKQTLKRNRKLYLSGFISICFIIINQIVYSQIDNDYNKNKQWFIDLQNNARKQQCIESEDIYHLMHEQFDKIDEEIKIININMIILCIFSSYTYNLVFAIFNFINIRIKLKKKTFSQQVQLVKLNEDKHKLSQLKIQNRIKERQEIQYKEYIPDDNDEEEEEKDDNIDNINQNNNNVLNEQQIKIQQINQDDFIKHAYPKKYKQDQKQRSMQQISSNSDFDQKQKQQHNFNNLNNNLNQFNNNNYNNQEEYDDDQEEQKYNNDYNDEQKYRIQTTDLNNSTYINQTMSEINQTQSAFQSQRSESSNIQFNTNLNESSLISEIDQNESINDMNYK